MHIPTTAVMVTGGMDSTALLYFLKENGILATPITVNYGQVAFNKQVEMLNFHIEKLNLPELVVIDIKYHDWQSKPGLFTPEYTPKENSPLEDWDKLRYKDFFVEGRNLIMVSYAMAYCSAHKIDELLAGYLYGEKEWEKRRTYKLMTGDNSPQFVDMMNLLSNVGFTHQVRFRAPFYEERLSKQDVFKYGKNIGLDYTKTYSCYFIPACGVCDNCLLRKDILHE
jgi:7-cyano-7-deazaguanine synthase